MLSGVSANTITIVKVQGNFLSRSVVVGGVSMFVGLGHGIDGNGQNSGEGNPVLLRMCRKSGSTSRKWLSAPLRDGGSSSIQRGISPITRP
jgi:hypothetical protein